MRSWKRQNTCLLSLVLLVAKHVADKSLVITDSRSRMIWLKIVAFYNRVGRARLLWRGFYWIGRSCDVEFYWIGCSCFVTSSGMFGQAHSIIISMTEQTMFYFRSDMEEITLIMDLEGFTLSRGFIVRELGWCTMQGENDSQHFYSRLRYRDLNV